MTKESVKEFLKKKDIEISLRRYGIDALGAMAQGLFCTLLVGTILSTLGTQFHLDFLVKTIATIGTAEYSVASLCTAMAGPAMAAAIGYALKSPPLVLFSLIVVGFAANALGGAGGPLARRRSTSSSRPWSPSASASALPPGGLLPSAKRPCGSATSSCGRPTCSPS